MVEAAERLSILGVPQAQDLISEQQERVIRAFADHVHAELLDEKPLRLGPVAEPGRRRGRTREDRILWARGGSARPPDKRAPL